MKKNLLYILTTIFILVACSEEPVVNVSPLNGKEVNFSATMSNGNHGSRTLYGAEVDNNDDKINDEIKVNWVHGDNITVYGTTCAVKESDYTVSTNGASGQNYANDLIKTGAAGVQWGADDESDFYAVYPAIEGNFSKNTAGNYEFTTAVSQYQNNTFTFDETNNKWVGTPMVNKDNITMSDALMYAYSEGVSAKPNGVVDLKFHPFSTVLKFKLEGWTVYQLDENLGTMKERESNAVVTVNSITIMAPVPIAGEQCIFEFVNGVPKYKEGASTDITIYPDYLPLEQNQDIEFCVFAIPQEYKMSADSPWTVIVETSEYGEYAFELTPQVKQTVKEGLVHKINIPTFTLNEEGKLDLTQLKANWIRYIPRNVYLSELSLPGAWYATNSDYQGTATLSDMYDKGIRAFNIDCRMTASADSWEEKWALITYYVQKSNPTYLLQCAGSETLTGQKVGGIERVSNVADGLTVESQLEQLSSLIKDDEYIMVVLTLAEKPKDLSGALSDAAETFGNNVDPANVLAAIKDILTRKGKTLKVFGYRDKDAGKTLNANTTVNDVLGSMVIKVNVNVDQDLVKDADGNITSGTNLANYAMSNVLLSEGSMASESKYITTPIVAGSFTSMNSASMYWGATAITNPVMTYYYHQAQLTTSSTTTASNSTTPSLYDRMSAIDDIIDQSADIYAANTHNALYQLGIGGYIDSNGEDRKTVASTLNKHVLDKVNAKLASSPSPIGMVLMNFCTDDTYNSVSLTNAIITMNNKFYLNRNQEADAWPDGNPFTGQ